VPEITTSFRVQDEQDAAYRQYLLLKRREPRGALGIVPELALTLPERSPDYASCGYRAEKLSVGDQ
jgi:hypothetical protein